MVFFKNLMVYAIDPDFSFEADAMVPGMERSIFKPCGPQQMTSMGWEPPLAPGSDALIHEGAGFMLMRARREERLLPATVVREAVNERAAAVEEARGHKVSRKERMEMREDLTFEMMPKAFRRSSHIQGMILKQAHCIVVDAANWKRAEEWLTLLRESLGSVPVTPIETQRSISTALTAWLSGKTSAPASIVFGEECELQSPREAGAVVRCRRQELEGEEIASHLKAGKLVTKLAIEWNQSLSFLLTDSHEIKRLRFSDGLTQQAKEDGVGDELAEQDATATLMALEFERFLPALWAQFGGTGRESD